MTWLEELATVAQLHLAGAQSYFLTVEGVPDRYCSCICVEEQWFNGFEALLCSLHSRLLYHTCLVDCIQVFIHQDMDFYLNVQLRTIFYAVCDLTASFRFSTSDVVETPGALCKDISSMHANIDGHLGRIAS